MDLTTEANIFVPSPSRKSNDLVLQREEEEGSMSSEEGTEETPVLKKIIVMKVKGEKVRPAVKDVKGNEGRILLEPHELKQNQTKGMLLREQITTTWDHLEIRLHMRSAIVLLMGCDLMPLPILEKLRLHKFSYLTHHYAFLLTCP